MLQLPLLLTQLSIICTVQCGPIWCPAWPLLRWMPSLDTCQYGHPTNRQRQIKGIYAGQQLYLACTKGLVYGKKHRCLQATSVLTCAVSSKNCGKQQILTQGHLWHVGQSDVHGGSSSWTQTACIMQRWEEAIHQMSMCT